MEDTKLASSPIEPYLAKLHQEDVELEDTNTLLHYPSVVHRRCRQILITPYLMTNDRLQTPASWCSSRKERRSRTGWRTFTLVATDALSPKTQNPMILRVLTQRSEDPLHSSLLNSRRSAGNRRRRQELRVPRSLPDRLLLERPG
jgi:hypothetical protein